jgi:hypothetical protein
MRLTSRATPSLQYLPASSRSCKRSSASRSAKAGSTIGSSIAVARPGCRRVSHCTFCCRLADAGVEAADIAAISGHLTLAMVQKYVAQRNKRAGAVRAMTKLVEHRAAKVAGGTK